MQSFIEQVLQKIVKENSDISNIIFVLPSKRAGTFLKNSLSKLLVKTTFAPEIYSTENFIEKISGLNFATSTEQLFTLYQSYLQTSKEKEKDSFLVFTKWGQTILQDFNEIDRYLVDTNQIFSHLSAVQEMNMYLEADKTQMISDYIKFWENLDGLYHHFNNTLLEKNKATQGYAYRIANDTIKKYIESTSDKKYIFIGFNALNKAEENIIQEFLKLETSEIYWDLDTYFLQDSIHDASYFIRQHKKNWSYFTQHSLNGISSNYLEPKKIEVIGVPKNVSQAKYVGNIIGALHQNKPKVLNETAIVLGDENLLNPIMNAIPEEIAHINITMGYPINKTPLAGMFNLIFELWQAKENKGWFYIHILNILSHPYIQQYLEEDKLNNANTIATKIKSRNWIYVKSQQLYTIVPQKKKELALLFSEKEFSPITFIEICLDIISHLKNKFQKLESSLELEYLYRFNTLFNQILIHVKEHEFIKDIKSLQSLYKELISSETLDFQGDALQGTQIMGMLESRNLDFETVILTSVNEGILPSGKSNNSFIPFDIKKIYGLPTYKEKDAVYTYHFYRLLQRAKNIYLIYNTEPNALEGNEKSRLITQLLTDENVAKNITEITATAAVKPTINKLEVVEKNEALLGLIKELAIKGFSPTSLTNYIRNPIDFYKKSILKIYDTDVVEENVAANTFGTIVHDTLEDLYQPFIGEFLNKKTLEALYPKIEPTVKGNFIKTYADGDITQGKNLIAYNVILKYIENFIKLEIKEIEKYKIKIVALEQDLDVHINVPTIGFPIRIKGKLDRVDEIDGITRIVDYKTGKVMAPDVAITDWEQITESYKKSKAFQLLCYTLLYDNQKPIENIKAGIISFKNLNAGILKFNFSRNDTIDKNTLLEYKNVLCLLIQEIFNPEIPFMEKEV
ncbi:PD-(D/E)XK nuclease family protein [Cellulophaga baltica]|uniref:PD-(D/E)XK nuclease family protein n=1 Tax=Cellulophaga TaxID=104264 RepID=UPI001C06EB3D|nr:MULTISPECIES: PD-(D/E)XK nuclease family protein [Cellulophaga]MBU2995772.1 PD-(D/E)XK nuclease family protein [Cellulophaga baltica]MDO6767166.1 PD-(D/E)XK nuclease family protein [Cellulophaga sp. 1_MG-2023]